MTFSLNNRLVLEEYIKQGLQPKFQGGIATPGQRDGLKGLTVLIDAYLSDGRHIPRGSTAYIKEEVLHNHAATVFKALTCATFPVKFMVVESSYVDFIDTPDEPEDAA